jgi:methylglutaconyl-CoA hydratase
MEPTLLTVRRDGPVAHLALTRPEVRNAFNAELIAALRTAFERLDADAGVRAVVLSGAGKTFCGGADVNWMRASLDLTREANLEDARAMSRMFRTIDRLTKPVIGRIHGAALGGGAGLVACCDVAIASADAIFGFTETKLGIMPAVISPFVLAKIGSSHARALALTGERFSAGRALAIGLVHEVVASEAGLDAAIDRVTNEVRSASPTGIAATKALFARVREEPYDATLETTAQAIAAQRTSAEGQDGLRAFLEKRPAAWMA